MTVSITACIAMFADGENREVMASSIHSQKQGNRVLNAETSGQKRVKIVGRGVTFSDGRWGSGGGGAGRSSGASVAWSGDERYDDDIGESYLGDSANGGAMPPGMAGRRMPPPPQAGESAGPRPGGANVPKKSHKPTQEELDQIEEESLRRAGASDSSDF